MTSVLDEVQLTLVESTQEVSDFLSWLGERRLILGVDSETTGLSLTKDRLRMIQFGDAMHGWAIPVEGPGAWSGLARQVLEQYEGPMVGQHLKFDAGFFTRAGYPWSWNKKHDTMIMNFLDDSIGPKSLKSVAALKVDPQARAGEQTLKRAMAKHRWTYETVPINFPGYWGYGAADPVLTARLAEVQWPLIQRYREAYDLELACERVLCDMELRGVYVDPDYCDGRRALLVGEVEVLREQLGDLNPNAPAQVIEALQKQGVDLRKRTEKGQLSVDDEVLRELADAGNETAALVVECRTKMKLLSAYFENILEFHEDGILHPHINQLQARTGRMSVTEPALQQIPRGTTVRDAFVAPPGCRMILVDYDNEELRVAAHYSGDPNMLRAFAENRNLHIETARRLYGTKTCDHEDKCQHYSTAKNAMFSKAYGAGVAKFAATAKIPMEEAASVFTLLDQLYPELNRTMARVTAAVRERAGDSGFGWVQLNDGRHLKVRSDKAYVGFNALIQGSCAVELKRALVDLDAAGLGQHVVLPIHDELMLYARTEDVDDVIPEVHRVMTHEDWRVPLTVSSKVVDRWGDNYR